MGPEQYGSFLIPIVMNQLPADVCLQITRVTNKDIWELDELLLVPRTELEVKEISGRVKVTNICNTIPRLQQKGLRSTASALQGRETGNHLVFFVRKIISQSHVVR